jgi:hypothetical protein
MFRPASALLLLALAACSDTISPRAERVFYRGDGAAAWGTVCLLNKRGFLGMGERGYVSVAHVTENGTPLVGPKDAVTRADALSDWSFLGIDPARLDPDDYPEMKPGQAVTIHGFPARDRDGEVLPGMVYTDDPLPPFWWIELRDSDDGIAAEGVIGGFSGSCVFDDRERLVAVVHANGFSRIEGTTHTWAKVVPIREAIRQAQGKGAHPAETMVAQATPPWPDAATSVAGAPAPAAASLRRIDPAPAWQPSTVQVQPAQPAATTPTYIEVAPVFLSEPAPLVEPAAPTPPVRWRVLPPVPEPALPPPPASWRRCADCL